MNKLSKALLITTGLVAVFAVTDVLADDSVHFIPKMEGQQYFECNATSGNSFTLQTHNVDLQGACPSGRVEGIAQDTLNTSYFSVKDAGMDPSVDISGGDVNCTLVKEHTKANDFGAGQGFCLAPPVGKINK